MQSMCFDPYGGLFFFLIVHVRGPFFVIGVYVNIIFVDTQYDFMHGV